MILLGLALLAQTAGLPANTAEAARLCGASSSKWPGTPLAQTAFSAYFALTASRETHGNQRIGEHIGEDRKSVV